MNAMKKVFQILLGLNGVMQLAMGLLMLVNFETAVTSLFQVSYVDDMAILGVGLAMNVIFTGVIALLGHFKNKTIQYTLRWPQANPQIHRLNWMIIFRDWP